MTHNSQPSHEKILNERITLKAGSLAILMAVLWGGNNIAIKFGLAGVSPFALAGIRFIIGSFIVLVWVFLTKVSVRLEIGEWRKLAKLGFIFVAQICLLNWGVYHTLAGRSTVFISTHPFFIALFAHLLIPGDRLSKSKIIGMAFSFLGVVLVFAESIAIKEFRYLIGDVTVLTSGLLLGFRLVYVKRLTQRIHPAKLLIWQAVFSIPTFFILSFIFENHIPYQLTTGVVLGILYQGVVIAGFAFIIYTRLLQRYIASRVGVFHFLTPVFGVLFSNLLLGEELSFGLIASMILVGAGITIVNYES